MAKKTKLNLPIKLPMDRVLNTCQMRLLSYVSFKYGPSFSTATWWAGDVLHQHAVMFSKCDQEDSDETQKRKKKEERKLLVFLSKPTNIYHMREDRYKDDSTIVCVCESLCVAVGGW